MLISKSDIMDKLHSDKLHNDQLVIGYDLGDRVSQISYCYLSSDTPETLSVTAGTELYNIPTVLCKRKDVGQWFYGREACRYAEEEDGILLENLITLARKDETVMVEGTRYEATALLTLFVKRSLSLLSLVARTESIGAMMFTCDVLDGKMIEILGIVSAGLGLKTKKIHFQSYEESFYYYMLFQPKELWNHQVLLCDFKEEQLKTYRMEYNKRTTPMVTFIQKQEYKTPDYGILPEEEYLRKKAMEERDQWFLDLLYPICKERILSSVYLIGDGFKENWMQESLKYLCKNRRVFQGNNLYSKGACYGIKERVQPSEHGKSYVFLGQDKLKANVGMQVLRRGVSSYFALLDAGQNWFDAKKSCEFILEEDNSFELLITPLNGKEAKLVEILLDELPKRPARTTRIGLEICLKSENRVEVCMKDEGFGELFPATGQTWREEFLIS